MLEARQGFRSFPKMLAQRLPVDLELIGDFGLGDANGRSALDEGPFRAALSCFWRAVRNNG
jgi:hypothetical protein